MKFHLSVLFLEYFFLGNPACALKGTEVKQVKQEDLKKDKISSVVSLSIKDDEFPEEWTHFCTGVLITNKFVLTAAHCFTGHLWGEIRVIAGSVDLRQGKKYYPQKWITFDRWAEIRNEPKAYKHNDIGIIKLTEKVACSVAVPSSLTTIENHKLVGKSSLLVGWGLEDDNQEFASQYLNKVDTKIMNLIECEQIVRRISDKIIMFSDQFLCTKGEPYALVGHGDSGGPVLSKNVVLGINKAVCPLNHTCDWSEDEINTHKVNIHTGIYPYRKFINDVLKNADSLIV